jgi:hypothetical protein
MCDRREKNEKKRDTNLENYQTEPAIGLKHACRAV